MKPLTDYLRKSFEKATIEQIADDYRAKGYSVKTDANVGPYRVDIVASKDEERIIIEVKTGRENSEAIRRIKEMTDYFKSIPYAKFLVVVSRFPEPKSIVFDEIEAVLYDYFILDFPSDLDALSTHTRVDDVYSVSIKEVVIQGGDLVINCSGMIGVTLQYGSDTEQEPEEAPMKMSFPFKFKGTIRYNGDGYEVTECDDLKIDTDAFYA